MPEPPAANDDANDPPSVEGARRRARRMAHLFVLVVATLFVASSGVQIVSGVYGLGVRPLGAAGRPPSPDERACSVGVRRLSGALDRAGSRLVASAEALGVKEAVGVFRSALSPEWDDAGAVARTCRSTPEGIDTWASLERLRSAEEQLARRSRAELGPLRRDLAAHLPLDLR